MMTKTEKSIRNKVKKLKQLNFGEIELLLSEIEYLRLRVDDLENQIRDHYCCSDLLASIYKLGNFMKIFRFPVTLKVETEIIVEADTIEEATKKAKKKDFTIDSNFSDSSIQKIYYDDFIEDEK